MNHRVSGRAIVSTLFALATTGSFACSGNVGFISPSLVAGDGATLGDPTDAGATGDDGAASPDAIGATGTGGPASGGGIAPAGSGGTAGATTHPQGGTTGSGGVAGTGGALGSGGARASGGTTGTMTGGGGTVASGGTTSTSGSGGARPPGSGGMTASSGGKVGSGGTGTGGQVAPPPPAGCPDAAPSGATIYYVCDCGGGADSDCVAGKDSNDGKSASTPFQTYDKARTQFASLKAGDRIEFCQGGVFTPTKGGSWVNGNCQAGNRCVVTGYKAPWASGDEGRPHIKSPSGQNAFDFSDAQNKHEEGYVFAGLEVEGSGTDWGFFFYADVDDVLVCDTYIHNFDIAAHLVANDPDGQTHNENIVLRGNTIKDNPGQGFLGGDNGLILDSNHFENNGAARASLNHNIYIGEEGVSNLTIINNDLYRAALANGQCSGTSLVVHGVIDGLLIQGNTIHEDSGKVGQGCWGIAVAPGYSTMEKFTNVTIRGNTVQDVGNMSIGVAACQNCLIENNVVINHQMINATAILAPSSDEGSEDAKDNQITIRSNSVLIDVGQGIGLTQEGTGNAVVNNAIYHSGGGNGGVACFVLGLPSSAYTEVDYNVCYTNGKGEWTQGKGTLDAWSKSSGLDAHSMSANPGFKSMASPYDLSPGSGSPLLNAADTKNCATTNFSGAARSSTPNIGAY